jgi:hypothetical protein
MIRVVVAILALLACVESAVSGPNPLVLVRDAAKRAKTIEAERDAWYQQLGLSWAVNAPSLRYQNY